MTAMTPTEKKKKEEEEEEEKEEERKKKKKEEERRNTKNQHSLPMWRENIKKNKKNIHTT